MAYQLVAEVVDHAPADLSAAELRALVAIAEWARPGTRRCERSRRELQRRLRMNSQESVSRVLNRLKARGMEVRVPLGKDKHGQPLFAVPGRRLVFELPLIPPPEGCECDACRGPAARAAEPSVLRADERSALRADEPSVLGEKGGRTVRTPRTVRPGAPDEPSAPIRTETVREEVTTAAAPHGAAELDSLDDERRVAVELVVDKLGVSPADALIAVATFIERHTPERPGAYIRSTLNRDPNALRRLLPGASTRITSLRPSGQSRSRRSALPPPCGQCDARPGDSPAARVIYDPEDPTAPLTPCPRCSPKAVSCA